MALLGPPEAAWAVIKGRGVGETTLRVWRYDDRGRLGPMPSFG